MGANKYKENYVLCWLATANQSGFPNVSPKEIFSWIDENKILIADIASSNSVRNIRENPNVCVSMLDVFIQRGVKIEGMADIISPENSDYYELEKPLVEMTKGLFKIRHILSISITRQSAILAPSYNIYPGKEEQDYLREAYQTYGVCPL